MTGPESDEMTVTDDFARSARLLFATGTIEEILGRLVALSVETIEGCDFAGIFLLEEAGVATTARTDPRVAEIDDLQLTSGEGPCLDAVSHEITYYAGDLREDERWPIFGPTAASQGVRSALALPLRAERTVGALNLYARYPHAFGVLDRGRGQLLAALAGLAVTSAQALEDQEQRTVRLQAALATREVIGQAQGILMERERLTGDQAFDILRRASQHLNIKLREVAQTLVETGERPETG